MIATPQTVLIFGAGLIGTSLAIALKTTTPNIVIDAIELQDTYAKDAEQHGVFRHVHRKQGDCDELWYDLIVLAIPARAACEVLSWSVLHGDVIMDVCSVKQPLVDAFAQLQHPNPHVFIPTHPMAGKASGGPKHADATLFQGRPWLFLESHRPTPSFIEWIRQTGAHPTFLATAHDHDAAMATVSHGIHLSSLAAMLATADSADAHAVSEFARIAGPAFWDITRLASSPTDFWVDTLLANREQVIHYLSRLTTHIAAFQSRLELADDTGIREKLDAARAHRLAFEQERDAGK